MITACIDGQEEGELVLIHLVHAEDAGEGFDDPGEVVAIKVDPPGVGATPRPDHLGAGADPEVARQTSGDPANRQAILKDGLGGLLDDAIGVDRVGAQKRQLGSEVEVAAGTVVDADLDGEEDRLVEVDIDRGAGDGPDRWRLLLAAVTRDDRGSKAHVTDQTRDLLDRRGTFRQRWAPWTRDGSMGFYARSTLAA